MKGYFGSGKIPTGRQFEDLIDSMLNVVDDGMDKSAGNGLQLSPLEDDGPVLEFFGNILDDEPLWKVRVNRRDGALRIQKGGEEESRLVLHPDGQIDVRGDVGIQGTVRATAFMGNYNAGRFPADGQWHDLSLEAEGKPSGCRAYRVVAGCGKKGKGKYALLEATAIHCYGSHRKIRGVQSWFGMRFNRIQLRWNKQGETWHLQIRTRCDYGEEVSIRFRVEELWQDHYMVD